MRVVVTGSTGMVGSSVIAELNRRGYTVTPMNRFHANLLESEEVFAFLKKVKPEAIVHCAARVGGVRGNSVFPVQFINDNLKMQLNVFEASLLLNVKKVLFVGSSCIYPVNSRLPIEEESFMTGVLEPTNRWYATAKIAGIMQIDAIRNQYGLEWLTALPTNVYGPEDNFALNTGHVMPSLIYKMVKAKIEKNSSVEIWGTGSAMREFIYSSDLARALVDLLSSKLELPSPYIVNVGTGEEISIRELSFLIARHVDYSGELVFDSSMPDGVPRKPLDSSRIYRLGWSPKVDLSSGIQKTVNWVLANYDRLRKVEVKDDIRDRRKDL